MENSRPKRKFKLNVFDIVIIAAALIAAFLILRAARSSGAAILSGGTTVTIRYTLELDNMTPESAEMVSPGDVLIDNVEKHMLGTVVAVEVKPYIPSRQNQLTGEYILSEVPGRKTAVVLVESQAVESGTNFTVGGGFVVRCGTEASVTGPRYMGSGYVTDFERGEG